MKRVIFNQKGGVGKTSITTNLAAISAAHGLRTLVVDLDPQCNTSQYLLGNAFEYATRDIRSFFSHHLNYSLLQKGLEDFITRTPYKNLDVVVANPELGFLEIKLESKHKIYKLRDALNELDGYDAVYIDTPPAFNFFSLSALIAADHCLIPFDCDEFSRRAIYVLLDNLLEVRCDHNSQLEVEGIIVNNFQTRARFPGEIVTRLKEEGQPVLNTLLPSSVKMRESHGLAVPLCHLAPGHMLTKQYLRLFYELHHGYRFLNRDAITLPQLNIA